MTDENKKVFYSKEKIIMIRIITKAIVAR